ncbi:hypothetical protein COV15_00735 [Candidatus Woesearchaeota archaeon CG10_big_fil_rev_8_21_14_0_10_34_12]|nr:MAG: hypothetical protein COV15_00735 [Candidatus Woesearchaeota archaeon CG10_big_fil_rev_8_21_14_0_10_34_12]
MARKYNFKSRGRRRNFGEEGIVTIIEKPGVKHSLRGRYEPVDFGDDDSEEHAVDGVLYGPGFIRRRSL